MLILAVPNVSNNLHVAYIIIYVSVSTACNKIVSNIPTGL